MDDQCTAFGPWLKQRRKALDLTQAALAQRTGCAVVTVRKLEAGEFRPSTPFAERLAAQLDLSAEECAAFVAFARTTPTAERAPLPDTVAARAIRDQHAHRLPLPRDVLIGRDDERAAVQQLLQRDDVGLVSLTGAGGVGKTRLALQVATDLAGAFRDGVVFVALEALADSALVPPAIARALDVQARSGRPILDQLSALLREREPPRASRSNVPLTRRVLRLPGRTSTPRRSRQPGARARR